MFDVIIAAAGESTRFGKSNKLLASLNGRTVLECSVRPFFAVSGLEKVIIATSSVLYDEVLSIQKLLGDKVVVCLGGETRTDTVRAALKLVTAEYVLVHDGARPFVSPAVISSVLAGAAENGACVPVLPLEESLAKIDVGYTPLDRNAYRSVQTPQGFNTSLISAAYDDAYGSYLDDATVYLTKYKNIVVCDGEKSNKKITTSDDLLQPDCRTGAGFDTHLLAEGRRLVLGGVTVPHDKGLAGHSDADVLVHAVMDALLSAAGKRDIGYYFPDNDVRYENADSMQLLAIVCKMLNVDGLIPKNVAATIIAEKPRLYDFIPDMVKNLAAVLGLPESYVSVLATTTEGAYDIGREQAISALATATVILQ